MYKLTDRQFETLQVIYDDTTKKGYPPTYAELCVKLQVSSKQTIRDLLDALSRKGFLEREPNRARAILLSKSAKEEIMKRVNASKFESHISNIDVSGSSNIFQWEYNGHINVDDGQIDHRPKQIWDVSYCINTITSSSSNLLANSSTTLQPIIETSNWNNMIEPTRQILKNINPLIVSPSISECIKESGYTVTDNQHLYSIIWSGIGNDHYFLRGKEYGSTTNITYVSSTYEHLLLPLYYSDDNTKYSISFLQQGLKNFSMWIDYPIYGGALKRSGEILWWSHSTANDIDDLRYLILADITGVTFKCRDMTLIRDISHTLPNIKIEYY